MRGGDGARWGIPACVIFGQAHTSPLSVAGSVTIQARGICVPVRLASVRRFRATRASIRKADLAAGKTQTETIIEISIHAWSWLDRFVCLRRQPAEARSFFGRGTMNSVRYSIGHIGLISI